MNGSHDHAIHGLGGGSLNEFIDAKVAEYEHFGVNEVLFSFSPYAHPIIFRPEVGAKRIKWIDMRIVTNKGGMFDV